ncbi:MAG: hypothetical protein IJQ94_01320 [Bacteroidales bacterium]|nr:hypothetical protein [Bacteroidales bacterium]
MPDDFFKQISQRGRDEETAENRRIHEIADELRRRCQIYETQSRNSKENVSCFEIERCVTEQYAKSVDLWIRLDNIERLGLPGPSGIVDAEINRKDNIKGTEL